MAVREKIKKLIKSPFYVARGLKYHASGRFYIPRPRFFCLIVTDRCNARCVMCSFWRREPAGEPTPDKIWEIFGSPLLDRLETVLLSGGEPTLRQDLARIVQAILDANQSVRQVNIVSNGVEPCLVERRIKDILKLPDHQRLNGSTIILSLDGTGKVHDQIRGVSHAFERVGETIARLKRLQKDFPIRIVLNCVVQRSNVADVPSLYGFARKEGLPISFWPVVMKIDDQDAFKRQQELSLEQLTELERLFNGPIELSLIERVFWQDYFRIMRGSPRRLPCAVLYNNLFMRTNGDVYACAMSSQIEPKAYGNVHQDRIDNIWFSKKAKAIRRKLKGSVCPTCPSGCGIISSLRNEVFYLAREAMRGK